MKRISILLIILFVCYIIFYDFRIGTLPVNNQSIAQPVITKKETVDKSSELPAYQVRVKQGDTVLSITEQYHGTLPTSIEQIINDFQLLNPKVSAEEIIIGKTYLFPDYKQ